MVQYTNILKIMDSYVLKTHDGTALPRHIRQKFRTFIRKYGELEEETLETYDGNGQTITHQEGNEMYCPTGFEEVKASNEGKTHEIHTHPIGEIVKMVPKAYVKALNIPTRFSLLDLQGNWDKKNDEGEYIYQSMSCCNEFGHLMTLSKNNHYAADKNGEAYSKVAERFNEVSKHYMENIYTPKFDENCEKILNEYKDEQIKQRKDGYPVVWVEDDVRKQLFQKAHEKTINEVGTYEGMLEKEGIYQDFENCNCKLKILRIKI